MAIINVKSIFRKKRRKLLDNILMKQPYSYSYEDIKIEVGKDVFPPDIGFASLDLIKTLRNYSADSALDMGTGTGIIAIAMKKYKIKNVLAIDNHLPAIECCKKNLKLNPKYSDIEVMKGNLFENVSDSRKFDLIVFNHTYSPAPRPIFGNNMDGGIELCKRFLLEAKNHLNKNGVILLSFSSMFHEDNNPLNVIKETGYDAKIVLQKENEGTSSYIYEFKLIA